MNIHVISPGAFTTIQDGGRFGHLTSGVGISGAFDRGAFALANRLVGNCENAAALECLAGGFTARADSAIVAAVTGARGPVFVNDTAVGRAVPIVMRPGDELRLGHPTDGIRSYLAFSGGIKTELVLTSASWDSLAELGPEPLTAAQLLHTGTPSHTVPSVDIAIERRFAATLAVTPGPHAKYFAHDALTTLLANTYVTSEASNRVGIRFHGAALERVPKMELPSAPMIRGAIQVPPDGEPVMLGPDHPVTGGYPVVAVVTDHSVDDAAQFTPGLHVRFQLA